MDDRLAVVTVRLALPVIGARAGDHWALRPRRYTFRLPRGIHRRHQRVSCAPRGGGAYVGRAVWNVAVATYCWVAPGWIHGALAGVTAIETICFAVTVSLVTPDVPPSLAVMFAVPRQPRRQSACRRHG